MCNPALIGLAITTVGTAVSIKQNNDNADAQSKLLQKQADASSTEIGIQASQEAGSRVEQARAEAARRLVAAGESGVSGNSVSAELNASMGKANVDVGNIASNALYGGINTALRAQSESLSIRKTGALSAGLQLASSGMGGYVSGLQIGDSLNKTPKTK